MFWGYLRFTEKSRTTVVVASVFSLVAVGGLSAAVCDFRFVEHPNPRHIMSPDRQLGIDARNGVPTNRGWSSRQPVAARSPAVAMVAEPTAPAAQPDHDGARSRITHLNQMPPGNGANAGAGQGFGHGNGFGNNNGGNAGFGSPAGGQGGVYVNPTVRLTPESNGVLRLRRIDAVRSRPAGRDRYSSDRNLDSI